MTSEPALEAAILAAPDDPAAYSVYGDWLEQQGDPRGKLVGLQIAGKHAAATKHLQEHAAVLAGPFARHRHRLAPGPLKPDRGAQSFLDHANETPIITWRNGFVVAIRYSYTDTKGYAASFDRENQLVRLAVPDGNLVEDELAAILAHPSCRFLRELTIVHGGDPFDDVVAVAGIGAAPRLVLRALTIGENIDRISTYQVTGLDRIWAGLPQLEELHVEASRIAPGKLVAPALRHATFMTGGMTGEGALAIGRGEFPKLESLDVYFGEPNYGASCTAADLAVLFARTDLRQLKHLGLRSSGFADALCELIPGAAIMNTVTELDLVGGLMTDDGARALAAGAAKLPVLERVELERNCLTAEGIAVLDEHWDVFADDQKADDERYVDVGE